MCWSAIQSQGQNNFRSLECSASLNQDLIPLRDYISFYISCCLLFFESGVSFVKCNKIGEELSSEGTYR